VASPVKALADATGFSNTPRQRVFPKNVKFFTVHSRVAAPQEIRSIEHKFEIVTNRGIPTSRPPLVPPVIKRRDAASAAVKTFPPIYKERVAAPTTTTGQLYPPRAQ
jgi:hypothetical protein